MFYDPSAQMKALKNEIARAKEKDMIKNMEQLREHSDAHGIDMNVVNANDMMLWVNNERDFIKYSKKGFKMMSGLYQTQLDEVKDKVECNRRECKKR